MSEHVARAALERMNLRPVAICEKHMAAVVADLHQMAKANPEAENERFQKERKVELCAAYGFTSSEHRKPFAFANGIAIIPVSGTLINRFGQSWSYVTGYNFIRSQLNQALADDDVKGIVFDLNSYGGEAAGCFELANEIFAARGQKPMVGVIDSNCYSACYAIASALDKIYATPSGGAGSIGVITMHVDMSGFFEKVGVKVELIYEGKHKADGHPFGPLPDDVRADIQSKIGVAYREFASLVARNRNLELKAVLDTESRTYDAEDAMKLGLVDAIASPIEAVRAFFGELSGSKIEGKTMSEQANKPAGGTENAPGVNANAPTTPASEASSTEARAAERARIAGILNCEEAKGREALASHLALNTDMDVDTAKGVLAAAPVQQQPQPAAKSDAFKAFMDRDNHPNVGADATTGGDDPAESPAMAILRAQEMATGMKVIGH